MFKLFIASLLFLPFFASASVPVSVLNGNYRQGDQGDDVRLLQTLLNLDPQTMIARVGAGSPGRETKFFGTKTRLALIKFQRKNKITGETGWLGPKTKQVLLRKNEQYIGSIFAANNNNGINLLPRRQDSQSVNRQNGINQTIPANKAGGPKLFSVSPNNGGNRIEVIIKGQNFTSSGNTIHTSYGNFNNISSSDGETIKFLIDLPTDQIFRDDETGEVNIPSGFTWPIQIYVSNSNGLSNNVTYTLKI